MKKKNILRGVGFLTTHKWILNSQLTSQQINILKSYLRPVTEDTDCTVDLQQKNIVLNTTYGKAILPFPNDLKVEEACE